MYEAVFVRKSGIEEEQPVFKAFPELHEFCTKDLFMRHPSNPQLWQHRGRLDDMQTFTSGSKYCPADVEDLLQSHKEINSALLVGTGRPQAGLLLEMMPGFEVDSVEDERATIERLWPTIEEANKMCTIYARMTKELVCFATPSKPLERTPKGTVQRAMSVKLYETELDELFATFKLKGNLVPKEISALPNLQPGREDHFGWTVKLPKSFITTGLLLIVCTVIYLSPMFA